MNTLPADFELPVGWTCTQCEPNKLVFRCDNGRFEVEATAAMVGSNQTGRQPGDYWEVRAHQHRGELTSDVLIARVTTQETARAALRTGMEQINHALQETLSTEGLALTTMFEESGGQQDPPISNATGHRYHPESP